jgi:hypothetical protein
MMEKVAVLMMDTRHGVSTYVYTTQELALKAVADFILTDLGEVDEEVESEIRELHAAGDHKGVMEAWNEWSIEAEHGEEYAVVVCPMNPKF